MSYYIIISYDLSYHNMPFLTMSCHAMPCYAMPCYAMPYHAMPYHTIYQVLLFSRCGFMKFEMHIYYTCTLTLFQGIFKMSYSCQHFPLTVSKNNIQKLDCICCNEKLMSCHSQIMLSIPFHVMKNNTMSQIAIPYNMNHTVPCHTKSYYILI